MKIIITIIGLLNGGFTLLNGIFVTVKEKYIGPEKPAPWAQIFDKLNIDVYRPRLAFHFVWLSVVNLVIWLMYK